MDMMMPERNISVGQKRFPPRATPARSAALTRPAMIVSATPMPIWDICVSVMGNANRRSWRNSALITLKQPTELEARILHDNTSQKSIRKFTPALTIGVGLRADDNFQIQLARRGYTSPKH